MLFTQTFAGHTLLPKGLLNTYKQIVLGANQDSRVSKPLLIFIPWFHPATNIFFRISSKFWICLKNIILSTSIGCNHLNYRAQENKKSRNNLRYIFWRKLCKQLPPNKRLMRDRVSSWWNACSFPSGETVLQTSGTVSISRVWHRWALRTEVRDHLCTSIKSKSWNFQCGRRESGQTFIYHSSGKNYSYKEILPVVSGLASAPKKGHTELL